MSSQKQRFRHLVRQETQALADGVLEGNRRALARAITLIESTRYDHRGAASALLQRLMPHSPEIRSAWGFRVCRGSANRPLSKRWATM